MNNSTVVEKIVDYIETHIDEDLSLDKIANALKCYNRVVTGVANEV